MLCKYSELEEIELSGREAVFHSFSILLRFFVNRRRNSADIDNLIVWNYMRMQDEFTFHNDDVWDSLTWRKQRHVAWLLEKELEDELKSSV